MGSKKWRSFEETKQFARSLGIRSSKEWEKLGSFRRPRDIPSRPWDIYADQWTSWGDFLGTGNIRGRQMNAMSFDDAREYVRRLGLSSEDEWRAYCNSGRRPAYIPRDPRKTYAGEYRTVGDWLGYAGLWTRQALLALLEDLRTQLPYLQESELYTIIQQGGAMPTLRNAFGGASPLAVLRDIRENDGQGLRTALRSDAFEEEPQDTLQDTMLPDARAPEQERLFDEAQVDPARELPTLALGDSLRAVDTLADLRSGLDDEVAEYLVANRVALLWEKHINERDDAIVADALVGEGGHYFNLIRARFSSEIEGVQALKVPEEWSFSLKDKDGREQPRQPNLMQKRTAWAVLNKQRVGNWSGVGSGKTLSAVLASRVTDASTTLVITNNATVRGWCEQIVAAFPDSIIATKPVTPVPGRFNYIVLNYEKFQQPNRNALVRELVELSPDFVVFDEVQLVKQRDRHVSIRRQALEALVSELAERDPGLHVLGMSATPVINNLLEARKLLEIVTGRDHADIATRPTVNNALAVHRALMINGFRYRPQYELEIRPITEVVNGNALLPELVNARGVLAVEQTLLTAKLDAIASHIRKGTLIYTHYVEGMVGPTRAYLERLGFRVGLYTGEDKSGLEPFKAGAVDVLIGSRAVGTGLDGLQTVCDQIVMISLPWTSAEYEQIIGRIRRQGSAFGSVSEIVPQVVLYHDGDHWSWDEARMATIRYKRTLSDCAVEGNIPEAVRISESEMLERSRMALDQWIKRIDEDGLVAIERERLTVPLPPDIREKVQVRHGDFTTLNNRWSISRSGTTHERLRQNPSEWYLYHTLYREARENWPEQPFERIAERIRVRPDWVVGDFGCGECLLEGALPDNRVIGLDHVGWDDSVVVCDISSTPLEDSSLDVAVFSLSLMGVNWTEYLNEAYRTLKPYGHLFIAEPQGRWQGHTAELEGAIQAAGFSVVGGGEQRYDFLYLTAVKV